MTPQEVLEDTISDPDLAALRLIHEAAGTGAPDAVVGRAVRRILTDLATERARRLAGGRPRSPRRVVASSDVVDLMGWLERKATSGALSPR
jgi:hypothetical protein